MVHLLFCPFLSNSTLVFFIENQIPAFRFGEAWGCFHFSCKWSLLWTRNALEFEKPCCLCFRVVMMFGELTDCCIDHTVILSHLWLRIITHSGTIVGRVIVWNRQPVDKPKTPWLKHTYPKARVGLHMTIQITRKHPSHWWSHLGQQKEKASPLLMEFRAEALNKINKV